ncbi:TPA: ABC transporter ATP-binding protein, partial [Streptococcus suis]
MTEKNIAVKVDHVSKFFKLPTEATQSLRTTMVNRFRGIKGYKEQHVLKDISFEVEKGDFFGILGRNGSGKSTLLKIISQIYVPEKGSVTVDGKLVSFIELGVGFNPELTGRENVYLNGALLGFSKEEIDAMYDDIVDFAELREFMNQKLKNYSSGMQVRLAFSVAIKAQGDVLILDEVLAVGDEAFQRKCNDYFQERKKSGKTTILVTHDMGAVKKYCNKAVLIENGLVKALGDPSDVANQYSLDNTVVQAQPKVDEVKEEVEEEQVVFVENLQVKLLSDKQITPNDPIEFEISY